MRKTKIICTIGPASNNEETIRELIKSGMDVARLNSAHATHEEQLERIKIIRKVSKELNKVAAVLFDTKGPEIRIGKFAEGKVSLVPGQQFTLTTRQIVGNENEVSINYLGLCGDVAPDNVILIDDGLIELKVEKVVDTDIICKVISGGLLSDRKGVNLPSLCLSIPAITPKDLDDFKFCVENDVDFIAASFIRKAADVVAIKEELKKLGGDIPIIAKIENEEGVQNIAEIVDVADGIMVARGDLGVEIPTEEVPIVQKMIIARCNAVGKPVITATQMLDSMIRNPRPTRAEVTDVANAILDGTDAIMLSGETAAGKFPIEAVQTMSRIALRAEMALSLEKSKTIVASTSITEAISHATFQIAKDLEVAAILTSTQTGITAQKLSKYRPKAPIIAVTPFEKVMRRMNIHWGVYPFLVNKAGTTDEMFEQAEVGAINSNIVKKGDLVVFTAGVRAGVPGTTNLLKVRRLGVEG